MRDREFMSTIFRHIQEMMRCYEKQMITILCKVPDLWILKTMRTVRASSVITAEIIKMPMDL